MPHRALFVAALLIACNGSDDGTDSGSSGIGLADITTDPEGTARSDQDVEVVILGDASGGDGTYQISWLSDAGVSWPQETLAASTTTKGEVWTVSVRANGTGGPGPAAEASVTIVNGPPSVSAAEFLPSTPTIGTDLSCVPVGADDPDDDTLTFKYVWERAGTTLSETSNTLPAGEVLTGQTITCYVTPNDGEVDGNTVSVSGAATNSPPTANGSTITPSNPVSTDNLTCTGSGGSDPDGDTVTFLSYQWSVNGTIVAETSNTLSASDTAKNDVVICTAIPYDGAASGTGTPSASVTIANSPPIVTQVLVSPANATSEDTLACTPSGSDPDNDTLTWTYEWYVGGTLQSETSNFLPPGTAPAGADVTCTATANDGTETTSLSSGSLTIVNTPPTVSGVAITPTNANGRQALTCSYASTSDPDSGQTVTVSYAWTLDGNAVGTGATLPADTGIKGQVAACIATPNDGITDGNAVSAQLTFTNAPPDQPTVGITPTTANSTNTLTCAATPATDYDGDGVTYTYTWFIGATQVGTGATLSSGLAFRDDVVRCEAVPNDGTADGQMGQATITIGNTAPTASTPSLTPTTAYETTTLSCASTLDDVDGDGTTATYRWTVAGSTVAPTTSSLTGTHFDKGNAVQCHVTPSDGDLTGTEVSSNTVTIRNSTPTQPEPELNPASTTEGTEPLVCDIVTDATDADPADASDLTYNFTWTLNGTTYTGATTTTVYAGDTIPAASVAEGSWVCRVEAVDNDAASSGFASSNTSTVGPPIDGFPLDNVCGTAVNSVCSGNCTTNTAQYVEAYCQIEGYGYATSYVTQTSGRWSPTVYYQDASTGLPETCADVIPFTSGYGAAASCTCATDVVCQTGETNQVGSDGSAGTNLTGEARGAWYLANTNKVIENFTAYFTMPSRCDVDFYVHQATSASGPWTQVWHGAVSTEGTGYHLSGPIDLRVVSGRYYALTYAVPSSCAGALYRYDSAPPSRAAGFGTHQGYLFSNGYPGYSAGWVFSNFGAGGIYGPQRITVSP